MKTTVLQDEFNAAVKLAAKAVASKPTLEVLQGLHLIARDDVLEVIGTDLGFWIKVEVGATASGDFHGGAIVPAKLFAKLTSKLPADRVEIESAGDKFTLECGAVSATLDIDGLAVYPPFPTPNSVGFTMSRDAFEKAVRDGTYATVLAEEVPAPTVAIGGLGDLLIHAENEVLREQVAALAGRG